MQTFARAVARLLAADDPRRVTYRVGLTERVGKVFVDWS
jgi:DNA primase